ncbi:MAG: methyltransferase domain-containing protein [Nitrospinota bacterium]
MNKPGQVAKKTGAEKFWDSFAASFDRFSRFSEWRWGPQKRKLFHRAEGETLFVGIGTGNDFPYIPSYLPVTAIDFSTKMLKIAEKKNRRPKSLTIKKEDVQRLSFQSESFNSALSSCVFCSVEDPVQGLTEVLRVLKKGGNFYLFEHTGSRNPLFHLMLILMNFLPGPNLTRRTVKNLEKAGFEILSVEYVFLDIVKSIHARKRDA